MERNPSPVKVNDKNREPPSYPIYQTHQGDTPLRSCVYCDSTDHRSHECSKVTQPSQRKRILQLKSLCFNCTGSDHKVTECRSRRRCFVCKRRHHTSICDKTEMAENSMRKVVWKIVFIAAVHVSLFLQVFAPSTERI